MKDFIKLVATDLDGTVLVNGKIANQSDVEAFIELQKNGILATIVTGQPFFRAIKTAAHFKMTDHFGFIISDNGAYIANHNRSVVKRSLGVSHDVFKKILNFFNDQDDIATFASSSTTDTTYVDTMKTLETLRNHPWFADSDFTFATDLKGDEVLHQLTVCAPKSKVQEVEKILSHFRHELNWSCDYDSDIAYFSINHIAASKATGLQTLNDEFQFGVENMVVFGDGPNDIEMFELVPHCVAVANSVPEILALAKYQTNSVESGGVGTFIRKNLL